MTGLATVVGRALGSVPRPARGALAPPTATGASSPSRRGRGRSGAATLGAEGASWRR